MLFAVLALLPKLEAYVICSKSLWCLGNSFIPYCCLLGGTTCCVWSNVTSRMWIGVFYMLSGGPASRGKDKHCILLLQKSCISNTSLLQFQRLSLSFPREAGLPWRLMHMLMSSTATLYMPLCTGLECSNWNVQCWTLASHFNGTAKLPLLVSVWLFAKGYGHKM